MIRFATFNPEEQYHHKREIVPLLRTIVEQKYLRGTISQSEYCPVLPLHYQSTFKVANHNHDPFSGVRLHNQQHRSVTTNSSQTGGYQH